MKRVVFLILLGTLLLKPDVAAEESALLLPPAWQRAWDSPAAADRPLQIVHEVDLGARLPKGVDPSSPAGDSKERARKGLAFYQQRGLGGLVCNVSFRNYLNSEENWARLVTAVEACRDLGLTVWIYDELGYPSGAAGGLVLARNRAYEAQELAYDAARPDPFVLRPAYEYTHASNNYHAARRYPNLLDDRAVACFLEVTHEAYYQRLKPQFGNTIQATFTDEPSLIAVNIGQIPEDARKQVKVEDPLDPNVKMLPRVPWCYDLAERYRQRYGEDLMAQRRRLFVGHEPEDRRVRTQYWSLVAELISDRYFGALERWCQAHGVASSGHTLWEEAVLHHVPLMGNGLKCLTRMHIPGLDLLNSDPEAVTHTGWLTAGLPASAGRLSGRRRVMTEVSDFSQKMGGQGPVSLAEMQATAAWQAAWGVTDFNLYYSPADRSADEYRQYGDFVGRLNAILKPATPESHVLLYYPIHDLWAEYLPVAEPLQLSSQSARAQQLVNSFGRLGQMLQRSQIPFTLIDHEHLAAATTEPDGALSIANQSYRTLVVPQGVELPTESAAVVARFQQRGGTVLRDREDFDTTSAESLRNKLQPPEQIEPASPQIVLGRFAREGFRLLLLVNVGKRPYEGVLKLRPRKAWTAFDPASGRVTVAATDESGDLSLRLEPRASVIYVQK